MPWDFNSFDLTNWKLTLPVDSDYFEDGNEDYTDGTAYEVKGYDDLEGFEAGEFFFYDDSIDALVFRAGTTGAKTSAGTRYVRTELREMEGDNGETNSAWSISEGGALSATLRVDELPDEESEGSAPWDYSRVIVGQIHGEDDELTRLYYDSQGDVYFANELTGGNGVDVDERSFYFEDENGNRPDISLGETFSYLINVEDGQLIVKIFADDTTYTASDIVEDGVTIDATEIIDDWYDDSFYFKAGLYMGVQGDDPDHPKYGDGFGEASFFAIDVGHEDGEGFDAWLGDDGGPITPPPPPSEGEVFDGSSGADVYVGTAGNDTVYGNSGGDDLRGGAGNDQMWGGGGWDALRGGDGNDNIRGNAGNDLLKGEGGNDTLRGGSGSDELWGNDGDDRIMAGRGADWLKGGNGADTYVFDWLDGVDTIADFSTSNGDMIELTNILDDATGLTSSNALSDGYIDLVQDGADTKVYIDLDGDNGSAAAKLQIILLDETASGLDLNDFIF
ncbi:MAG: polysaccharide lyase family 7 protein [Pseudomonadota bacterium]